MYIKRKLGDITMNNIICISGRFNFEERRTKGILKMGLSRNPKKIFYKIKLKGVIE